MYSPKETKTYFELLGADNYERDAVKFNYQAPTIIAQMILGSLPQNHNLKEVIDFACGTGLSGKPFLDCNFTVDGFDLVESMLEKAVEKGYRKVKKINLVDELTRTDNSYDIAISVGALGEFIASEFSVVSKMIKSLREQAVLGFTLGDYGFRNYYQSLLEFIKDNGFEIKAFQRDFAYYRLQVISPHIRTTSFETTEAVYYHYCIALRR